MKEMRDRKECISVCVCELGTETKVCRWVCVEGECPKFNVINWSAFEY